MSNNFTAFGNFSVKVQAFVPRAMGGQSLHTSLQKQGSFTPTHQCVSQSMNYDSPVSKQCFAANANTGGFSDYSSGHMQPVMGQQGKCEQASGAFTPTHNQSYPVYPTGMSYAPQ